jgi:hypothetical protein
MAPCREEQLELSVADLGVKQVHPGRVDLDKHGAVADRRLRDLADLHRTLVLADEVGLHDRALSEGSVVGRGSVSEKLERPLDEVLVELEHPAVPGVGIQDELAVRPCR